MNKELLAKIDKAKGRVKRILDEQFPDGWRLFGDCSPDVLKKEENDEN